MTKKEYNGWTNYETWLVKLWMDNDQGSYCYFQELAEAIYAADPEEPEVSDLADKIKEAHEEALPDLRGFAADLMNSALSEVNWEEIATSLLSDAKEALA